MRLDLDTLMPGLVRLRQLDRSHLMGDMTAGLLVAALAIPQALGYAVVAGVPVQVGLYSIPPALFAYALFGSSRVLFMGPVSTVSVLSGTVVRGLAGGDSAKAIGLTAALAIIAGIVLIAIGLLRLGWVAQFLSEPIVTGFVTGLVVIIVAGEIPALLGIPSPSGSLFEKLWAILIAVPKAQPMTLLVAAAALLLLFGGSKLAPRMPWSLLAIVGGILASRLLDLPGRGIAVVGTVPVGLPVPTIPGISLGDLSNLVTGGFALAAVGIAEGLAAAHTFAGKESRGDLKDNAEFIANGVANVASGFFSGMGVGGSLSKTAAVVRAGGRSQVFGLVAAVVAMLVLLLAAGLLTPLPRAVLSAVVVHAVWGLVHPRKFTYYKRVRRNDFVGSIAALVGVLIAGPLNGLLIAIGQSLLGLIYRSMQVHIDEMGKVPGEKAAWGAISHDPNRKSVKSVCVLRPDGPVFWANSDQVIRRVSRLTRKRQDVRALVLDVEATNQLDATTAERLIELIKQLREEDIEVYLVRVFGNVKGVMQRSGVLDMLGEDRIWHSISAGVKAAKTDIQDRMRRDEQLSDDFWDPYEAAAEDAMLADEGPEVILTRGSDREDEIERFDRDRFTLDFDDFDAYNEWSPPDDGTAPDGFASATAPAPSQVAVIAPDHGHGQAQPAQQAHEDDDDHGHGHDHDGHHGDRRRKRSAK